MKTRVVNLRLDEPFDVRIDRRSPWGNPVRMAREDDQEIVLERFERWVASDDPRAVWIREHVHELRGKRLACWCAPAGGVTAADRPWCCHGQILVQMADQAPVSDEDRDYSLRVAGGRRDG